MKAIAPVMLLAFLSTCSRNNAVDLAQKLNVEFSALVPTHSQRPVVVKFLRDRQIGYFEAPGQRLITASIPDVDKNMLTRTGVYMKFHFDAEGRLTDYEIKAITTGL